MYLNEEYDVIQFVTYHKGCYATGDRIVGLPLTLWIRDHPVVSRDLFLNWTKDMFSLLQNFHASREKEAYRYVNPWAFIVSEEEKLFLADIGSPDNVRLVKNMKKRMVREHFLPEEEPYYQRQSMSLDAYGLGKSLQFFLSNVEVRPQLTRKEEAAFQKYVGKCIRQYEKNQIHSFDELEKFFPSLNSRKEKKRNGFWKPLAAIFVIVLLAVLAKGYLQHTAKASKSKTTESIHGSSVVIADASTADDAGTDSLSDDLSSGEEKKDKYAQNENSEALNLELGILYMMDLNNYQKSQECFEEAGVDGFAQISECLQKEVIPEESLKTAVKEADNVKELELENSLKAGLYAGIVRACTYLDMDEEKEIRDTVIEYGKLYLGLDEKYKLEVLGNLALAYESAKEYDNAISMYTEQLNDEESEQMKEELYGKLSELYMAAGNQEEALETINTGIKKYPDSIELYTKKVSIYLEDEKMGEDALMEKIQLALDDCSKLSEDETFAKLLEEHDFTIKKGKVCEK